MTVDYFIDKTAPTGDFEVIYEVPIAEIEAMKKNKQQIENSTPRPSSSSSSSGSKSVSSSNNTQSNTNQINSSLNVPSINTARNVYRP